eukprot:g1228.t1
MNFIFPKGDRCSKDVGDIALSRDKKYLYVVDCGAHVIWCCNLVSKKAFIIAGKFKTKGYADGPCDKALFKYPCGVAVSGDDQCIYVSDSSNYCIRKIDMRSGAVSTLAGHLKAVHVDGIGVEAGFSYPTGLAMCVTKQMLYVADSEDHTIRQIDVSTGEVRTIAGCPRCEGDVDAPYPLSRLYGPRDLAVDEERDTLYICDSLNHKIRGLRLTAPPPTGEDISEDGAALIYRYAVETVVGRGKLMSGVAKLSFPDGVLLNEEGTQLYISDDSGIQVIALKPAVSQNIRVPPSSLANDLMKMSGNAALPQGTVSFHLVVSDRRIEHVSKCILCVRSRHFHDMIERNISADVIYIPNEKFDVFHAVVSYLITDKLDATKLNLRDKFRLLRLACEYNIRRLRVLCLVEIGNECAQVPSIVPSIQTIADVMRKRKEEKATVEKEAKIKKETTLYEGNDVTDNDEDENEDEDFDRSVLCLFQKLRTAFVEKSAVFSASPGHLNALSDMGVAKALIKAMASELARVKESVGLARRNSPVKIASCD